MEQEMRELYNEDVASRVGPESCVGDPRGRSEALTGGVRAGLLSRETPTDFRVPTLFKWRKARLLAALYASRWRTLRGRRTQARTTSSMHENREISWSPGWLLMMPRPGWIAGWQISAGRAARGTLRR
jgi:hypothetical protein